MNTSEHERQLVLAWQARDRGSRRRRTLLPYRPAHTPQYYLFIAPGVDQVLLASICIAFNIVKEQYGQ